jgi:hypothetical protein
MDQKQSVLAKIYFGVPRFVGEAFRGTKVPTILVSVSFIGVPFAFAIYLAAHMMLFHSALPFELFVAGVTQFQVESNPARASHLPADTAALMRRMTPEQKKTGQVIFKCFVVFSIYNAIIVLWWCHRVFKFLNQKAKVAARRT